MDEEILNLIMDLILGGYETTSNLIALILKFLTECPKALEHY
jgi:cytochrome P450